jgi:hypothetical protein
MCTYRMALERVKSRVYIFVEEALLSFSVVHS